MPSKLGMANAGEKLGMDSALCCSIVRQFIFDFLKIILVL